MEFQSFLVNFYMEMNTDKRRHYAESLLHPSDSVYSVHGRATYRTSTNRYKDRDQLNNLM